MTQKRRENLERERTITFYAYFFYNGRFIAYVIEKDQLATSRCIH